MMKLVYIYQKYLLKEMDIFTFFNIDIVISVETQLDAVVSMLAWLRALQMQMSLASVLMGHPLAVRRSTICKC